MMAQLPAAWPRCRQNPRLLMHNLDCPACVGLELGGWGEVAGAQLPGFVVGIGMGTGKALQLHGPDPVAPQAGSSQQGICCLPLI